MAQSDAERGVETKKVNIRLTARLLDEVDKTWKERGYNSRSEFIRQSIRDTIHEPQLSARTLESLLVSEHQRERDETISAEEMRSRYLDDE